MASHHHNKTRVSCMLAESSPASPASHLGVRAYIRTAHSGGGWAVGAGWSAAEQSLLPCRHTARPRLPRMQCIHGTFMAPTTVINTAAAASCSLTLEQALGKVLLQRCVRQAQARLLKQLHIVGVGPAGGAGRGGREGGVDLLCVGWVGLAGTICYMPTPQALLCCRQQAGQHSRHIRHRAATQTPADSS